MLRKRDLLVLALARPDRAIRAGAWWILGRRLRAYHQARHALARLPFAYERWLANTRAQDLASLMREHDLDFASGGAFGIHIHATGGEKDLRAAIRSALRQDWPARRVYVSGRIPDWLDSEAGRAGSPILCLPCDETEPPYKEILDDALATGIAWVVPIPPLARLPASALSAYAAHLQRGVPADTVLLYGDQDTQLSRTRRQDPWLKPDWDPLMFFAQDYIGAGCALSVRAALECVGQTQASGIYALLLALAGRRENGVEHVHRVTISMAPGAWHRDAPLARSVLADYLARTGDESLEPAAFGTSRIVPPLPATLPKVSILVPTRDRLELLERCVDGVLKDTDYPELELIVIDNGSQEKRTLAYLEGLAADPRARVLRDEGDFNFARLNNLAAAQAQGEFLCLLNNDIEIHDPSWLKEMMRFAQRPGTGAVGARLLYPDRTIQHAGVTVGLGNAAGHAHRGQAESAAGYFGQTHITRRVMAVTAACLLLPRDLYEEVGGLDEESFAVAYNDIDLCLKIAQTGRHNIYAASACLIHHESKSRGSDFAAGQLARYLRELAIFQQRWSTQSFQDPFHHPALDRASEVFRFDPATAWLGLTEKPARQV